MNFGIIGLGTMGSIIAKDLLKKKNLLFEKYFMFDILPKQLDQFKSNSNVSICDNIKFLVENSDMILFAVKPYQMDKVLQEISQVDYNEKIFISIAAGLKISFYRSILKEKCFICRVMPNILYSVGAGAAGITIDSQLSTEKAEIIQKIFELSGKVILCEEKQLDVVTGLSGSGPAYIFMIIEAMADGAVKMGLSREKAYLLAAQTVLGAGKQVLETNLHPGILKDMVCTPGGTTIEAISVLEKGSLRSLLINAVEAASKKAHELNP